jgi:Asp-tRNA(Asn)/Glu-tRNA(Gln) amidotransferase A subunit family amidase
MRKITRFPLIAAVCVLLGAASLPGQEASFRLEEATISSLQQAMDSGVLTSERLVAFYLERIRRYDDDGPVLNSVINLNPGALDAARALDVERRASGPRGPLHGIPVLLKDNYDAFGLPTTAGCLALATSFPPDDAFQTRRLREAGAVILGKANMDEFAANVIGVSSLGGQTRNPYDTSRSPAGSSAGTAAAIAANLAVVGTGTDTGGSIRMPAAWCGIVGLKPTFGLTSRDGIAPLIPWRDTAGPLARTVEDAAALLDVLAGVDPADPATAASEGKVPPSYTDFLDPERLRGARIGVARALLERATLDSAVMAVFEAAVRDLHDAGAELIDPLPMGEVASRWTEDQRVDFSQLVGFEHDFDRYLESLGPGAPFQSLGQILASGRYLRSLDSWFFPYLRGDVPTEQDRLWPQIDSARTALQAAILGVMEAERLDAILYPPLTVPPRFIGQCVCDYTLVTNADFASALGFPAIVVPAGFASLGLPVGIELLGRPFSEATLIGLGYAYEQATHHRVPPASAPALDCNRNSVPDENDVLSGSSADDNRNGVPDECESVLEVSVDRIDFGAVHVGESAPGEFNIRSTGRAAVEITRIAIGSGFTPNPDLRLVPTFEPVILQPGEAASYEVIYTPSTAEPDRGTLTVLSDARTGSRLLIALEGTGVPVKRTPFHRGDPNASGDIDVSDAITIVGFLFLGEPQTLSCLESADANNDGAIDVSDGIYLLSWLFTGGPEPPAPGPTGADCGVDPDPAGSPGDLGCESYPACS